MTKKILLSLAIANLFGGSLFAQKITYQLEGITQDTDNGKRAYLKTFNAAKTNLIAIDSTTIKNGTFVFEESLDHGNKIRFIQIDDSPYSTALFVADEGNVKMDIKDETQKIGGTPANEELQALLGQELELKEKAKQVIQYYSDNNTEGANDQNKLSNAVDMITGEVKKLRFDYIRKNIDKEQGEFMLLNSADIFSADTLLLLIDETQPSFKNSDVVKQIREYYEPQLSKKPGSQFKDISLKDPKGKSVKLSDYVGKGKVVLVDFWASWCGPCIKEMPSVVRLYKDYKDKGLEIVGISLDETEDSWKNAITRLDMTWPQMSDLKGWKSSVVNLYGVYSIPLTILIDGNGVIVGENLRGSELTNKLNEILK